LYNEYSPEASKQKLHFNLELAPKIGHVSTSRLYLHELLQNFITNAIKYTREGSVTLAISKKQDTIFFSVSDTGIGISKSDQAKIFNKFYRSEDYRTRETGGTGLGLYVAMKLSKKLGTHINLKSRLNHGSTFSFELPAHSSEK
jgi:signal transduction histidine kinase